MENMSNNKNNTRVHYLAAMTVPHVDGDIYRIVHGGQTEKEKEKGRSKKWKEEKSKEEKE